MNNNIVMISSKIPRVNNGKKQYISMGNDFARRLYNESVDYYTNTRRKDIKDCKGYLQNDLTQCINNAKNKMRGKNSGHTFGWSADQENILGSLCLETSMAKAVKK